MKTVCSHLKRSDGRRLTAPNIIYKIYKITSGHIQKTFTHHTFQKIINNSKLLLRAINYCKSNKSTVSAVWRSTTARFPWSFISLVIIFHNTVIISFDISCSLFRGASGITHCGTSWTWWSFMMLMWRANKSVCSQNATFSCGNAKWDF